MKRNKIAAIIGAAAMTCSISFFKVSCEEYCDTLKYIIREDKAVITGYSGNPEKLVIPEKIDGKEVVGIRENAFYRCESLKEISLPQTAVFVGHHAFFECTSLEEAKLSDNIYSIGEGAFSGCISLSEVKLPQQLKTLEKGSFFNCVSLSEAELSSSVEEIGDYAFANCHSLETTEFGEKLMSVGDYAFAGCEDLGRVYIPDNVMNVGCGSFGYTVSGEKMKSDLTISGSDKSLGKLYAEENSVKYDNTDSREGEKKSSAVPVAMMIGSGIGLVLVKGVPKLKRLGVRRKCKL